jgi:hypothetical protein
MAFFKTNTKRNDARERIKNLENITLMSTINNGLLNTTTYKSKIVLFENNKLKSTKDHKTLLKVTKGFFNLEDCCSMPKLRAVNLEDGLYSKIKINRQEILANSTCNRQPLYDVYDCDEKIQNLPISQKDKNFSYPIPVYKNTCCDVNPIRRPVNLTSTENHTKYLPMMSKIKSYKYRTTDTIDPVKFPNFDIVNENNMVGYFRNNIYNVSNFCDTTANSNTKTNSNTQTNRVGHRIKYSTYDSNTNCRCSDYDDYILNTSEESSTIPEIDTATSSFFSRKWSSFNN